MPSYPFFIVTVISTYETFEKPLSQEITSQGYCYQALIFIYLKNVGVKSDDIDTYINFLTEFAYLFYEKDLLELPKSDFEVFMNNYLDEYNLPIEEETLISNLQKTNIIKLDSFNNYSFRYPYLYYFFVAKYLAEHLDSSKGVISSIIKNLHVNENAYISVFLAHHSKSESILDEIVINAMTLFDDFRPATLNKKDLSFFDEQVDVIAEAVLSDQSPERERKNRLQTQDELEDRNKTDTNIDSENPDTNDTFEIDMRRSIKTVEVMGRIIKNRAGSLKKEKLYQVFEEGMKVHLRILDSFFDFIKDNEKQLEIIEYISNRIKIIVEKNDKKISDKELLNISRRLFWNINFSIVYGHINKIIHSLGSDKLINIVNKVCGGINSPASFLVQHGILMWYNKNLQTNRIADKIDSDDFSKTAENIIKHMIVNHCSIHSISYRDRQKVGEVLGIPTKKLLLSRLENE